MTEGIGDITSDKVGTGARYNNGKMPVHLLPARIIYELYEYSGIVEDRYDYVIALKRIAEWQEGGKPDLLIAALDALGKPREVIRAVADVFDYGRKKYAEWNWAKGMAWSVPMACAVRHLIDLIEGETVDHESGLPLVGHVGCNLVMLHTYHRTFLQGDDRTPYLREPTGE